MQTGRRALSLYENKGVVCPFSFVTYLCVFVKINVRTDSIFVC